ncbi:putative ATP-dependent endonuclease of the OLDfamily YbjD subgroup [Salmonella enterica subsp. enterica]|uniref:Putative ATP-dependent endonuclease of the OLDfamily YbjD subgroup n=1 Tax=Salmonella enterica I TaxID=59201 RepID=A0A379UMC2_SALET|nr:putative ATP-dependent endonuclease of the OLDfamily YbjD subgroup [Salmonella enterica subsp. enterica]
MEGETETWVINELARQCGHHFDAEGIKVIEFAQSGLKPLVKFARRMGIEWHVLVDGDEAGKKYAATVRSLLNNDREEEREHLTALPALDMEHFMYRQGFADVFHRVAQLPPNVPMNTGKLSLKLSTARQSRIWRLKSRWKLGGAELTPCRRCSERCSRAWFGWRGPGGLTFECGRNLFDDAIE